MRSLSKLLSAVVVLLMAGSSSALASPTLVTNRYPLAGERSELALDGSTTLVGGYESETTNVVRAFTPGQAPKTIARATIKPETGEFGDSMYFAASESRLVMLDHGRSFTYKGSGELRYERLLTGPLGGLLSELPNTCGVTPTLDPEVTSEAGIPAHSAIAIDGELAGYDSYGCLVVQDFATGLKRVIPLQATLDPVIKGELQRLTEATTLRIAGRLVAYRSNPPAGEGPASIVVYDFDTGEQLYKVALPEGAPTFDLEPDGTLVIANPSTCEATVSTISSPSPTALGVPACKVQASDRRTRADRRPGRSRTPDPRLDVAADPGPAPNRGSRQARCPRKRPRRNERNGSPLHPSRLLGREHLSNLAGRTGRPATRARDLPDHRQPTRRDTDHQDAARAASLPARLQRQPRRAHRDRQAGAHRRRRAEHHRQRAPEHLDRAGRPRNSDPAPRRSGRRSPYPQPSSCAGYDTNNGSI